MAVIQTGDLYHTAYLLCAVGSHREARAKLLLRFGSTDRNGDYFCRSTTFLDTKRFFQCDLVEGVYAHFDAIGFDTTTVTLDLDTDVVVHNALQADNDLVHLFDSRLSVEGRDNTRRAGIVQDCGTVYKYVNSVMAYMVSLCPRNEF